MKKNASAILLIVAIFVVDTSAAEENEQNGDRSSNRATPYGTLAYYTLLKESGYPITQFEKPLTELKPGDVGTLIVIAPPVTNNPGQDEFKSLNNWVEAGGLLIIIDRDIRVTFGDIAVNTQQAYSKAVVRPLQPTTYTRGVERVSLSEYATRVKLENREATAHVGDYQGAVVADLKFGNGRVVFLTDPYVVANNGIREADNAMLAVSLLAERPEGRIAFDEYHHGYGVRPARGQSLMSYFQGTPIPWMVWQGVLITALVIYTYSRRFGRPVPLKRERRTTNLEF